MSDCEVAKAATGLANASAPAPMSNLKASLRVTVRAGASALDARRLLVP